MAELTEHEAELRTISQDQTYDGSSTFMCVPNDYRIQDLEKFNEAPRRIRTDHVFLSPKSLAEYVSAYTDEMTTILFECPKEKEVTAVLDYHWTSPSHCTHKAKFKAEYSAQYKAWLDICQRPLSQLAAGEFLEERALDVVQPAAADIMEIIMAFDALKKVTFRQSTRLHDGQRQFHYSEENEARGSVTLPEELQILAPVFDGMEPQKIRIRLRYRIEDGSLRFTFKIHDRQDLEDTAFVRCGDSIETGIRGTVLRLKTSSI